MCCYNLVVLWRKWMYGVIIKFVLWNCWEIGELKVGKLSLLYWSFFFWYWGFCNVVDFVDIGYG